MMPEQQTQPDLKQAPGRPFPWHCPKCRKKEVWLATIPYRCERTHDGRLHTIELPRLSVPRCSHCGELVFNYPAEEEINQALRTHLRLLTPEQIRKGRLELGLKQKELAERLGVAEATLSRWETGSQMQSRAMDNFLRVYFAVPQVRVALVGENLDPNFGTCPVPASVD